MTSIIGIQRVGRGEGEGGRKIVKCVHTRTELSIESCAAEGYAYIRNPFPALSVFTFAVPKAFGSWEQKACLDGAQSGAAEKCCPVAVNEVLLQAGGRYAHPPPATRWTRMWLLLRAVSPTE